MGKKKKSKRRRLLYWLLFDIAAGALVIGLLLYKPSRYNPVLAPVANADEQRVHPYLHRDLGATLYNGAQSRRPFEMVILDKALNEAIAQAKWPQQSEGIALSAPEILFIPGRIVLMGTANVQGTGFVVTIELGPKLDERGDLHLTIEKFKVGAMNITLLAKIVAKKMYQERIEIESIDMDNIGTKIVASLLTDEPFAPVLEVDDKQVRLKSFEITQGKLVAQLVPAK